MSYSSYCTSILSATSDEDMSVIDMGDVNLSGVPSYDSNFFQILEEGNPLEQDTVHTLDAPFSFDPEAFIESLMILEASFEEFDELEASAVLILEELHADDEGLDNNNE